MTMRFVSFDFPFVDFVLFVVVFRDLRMLMAFLFVLIYGHSQVAD